ncbi:MAG: helix-turn-helix transcriptional regulator [Clostridia bacterium]|nr:helix-turn-helix transcriptional regulator [Clostridia bacterium]
MFINKTRDGKNNVCGEQIAKLRKEMKISQRKLADKLQIAGLDVDKNAVQRMESGQRFITDIEVVYLVKVLKCSFEDLFDLKAGDDL